MKATESRITAAAALRAGTWPDEADWVITEAVGHLIAAITAGDRPMSDSEAANAAGALNKHRRYDQTCRFADAWRAQGRFDLRLGKHHAQAIIESGNLDDAAERISGLLVRAEMLQPATEDERRAVARETTELRGLLGRVAKDHYVSRRRSRNDYDERCDSLLERARQIYAQEYADAPARYWQGINALALEACRNRERAQPPAEDFGARVQRLIQPLQQQADTHEAQRCELDRRASDVSEQPADLPGAKAWREADRDMPWLYATLSEAQLALGDCGAAEDWLRRAMDHVQFGPFNLASYARQLREIWDGDALRPERNCAGRLAALLLEHERTRQNTVTLSTSQLEALRVIDSDFEKQFSAATGFDFLRIATACDSIGRVCSLAGTNCGSGFLIERQRLWPAGPAGLVFVTNAHVISPSYAGAALKPEEACVRFGMESFATGRPARSHRVGRVLFTSPPGRLSKLTEHYTDLDITVVELETLPRRAHGLAINLTLPALGQPAYVIGYPGSSNVTLSVNDSSVVDKDTLPRLFHYRTPTDYGSSGSPVFNTDWEVIGVHHAGSFTAPRLTGTGSHNANEGIAFWALQQGLSLEGGLPAPTAATSAVRAGGSTQALGLAAQAIALTTQSLNLASQTVALTAHALGMTAPAPPRGNRGAAS